MKLQTTTLITSTALIFFTMASCKENKNMIHETEQKTEEIEVGAITIEKLKGSPAYADAILTMNNPETGTLNTGEVDFAFTIENYELGVQTEGSNTGRLANSGKGQHIHFILNNEPYSAHYEPTFMKTIPEGTHHLVSFLSRSYHESVKNDNSVVVQKLMIGDDPKDTSAINIEAPTLIYSRPKGEYIGKDAENILLDFFVLNTALSKDGNKVRATINGKKFIITEWVPYIIKGLPFGEVSIELSLIDAEGNVIPGPFNTVTRKVLLKEQ